MVGVIDILVRIFTTTHRRHITLLLLSVVASVLVGAGLFALAEQLPYTTGLYWAVTTATTVGYGDVTPHNAVGRLIASAVMLTSIPLLAAAFALLTGGAAAAGVRRILTMQNRFPEGAYRLVVGMNSTVPPILDELEIAGVPVVLAADVDPGSVRPGVHVVRGDPTDLATLRAARPEGAQQALITGASDGDVLVSAVILRKLAPDLPITALVTSQSVREALDDLGVHQVVSAHQLLARTLAATLETPHAGELVTALVEAREHVLSELNVDATTAGKRLSAVRDERAGLVLALVHGGKVTLGVNEDPVLAEGDRLLIAERPAAKAR
jgi:voltage-gated potassium channel